MQNNVLILDFGSQYTQLIARRVRELNVYCEIHPYNKIPKNLNYFKALILSGSPYSVREPNSPRVNLSVLLEKFPTLAVCYGAQLIAQEMGGLVSASNIREYGRANLFLKEKNSVLFDGISNNTQVWMSHSDTIKKLPDNSLLLASSDDVENVAYRFSENVYCLQFHPEVYHTIEGKKILENFLTKISSLEQTWTPDSFIDSTITELRKKIGGDKVILGLSGGVANNELIRSEYGKLCQDQELKFLPAEKRHTGDNAAMIAFAAISQPSGMVDNAAQSLSFLPSLRIDH